MISDDDLYRLALFLGSAAMVLIVGYHYIEVNAKDDEKATAQRAGKQSAALNNRRFRPVVDRRDAQSP
ncbi:hypothetical protein J7T55_006805 [Diaporthe amygdali]|uniref:uncharacterized protein n=1 Tax=Phomopsis amygdali TaxID=1214568 RepID=UPI0022FE8B40|nr:uncharacterized protein J7T55_006805 [Diaporthe amygdali]KAJ0125459.1 hypothetical protein J7T55_006805 [Diaporthe amygdali]